MKIFNAKVEAGARAHEVAAIKDVLSRAGLEAEFRDDVWRFSAGAVLPWLVYITVAAPFVAFISAFGRKTGELAAEDAWPLFKGFVKQLTDARGGDKNG